MIEAGSHLFLIVSFDCVDHLLKNKQKTLLLFKSINNNYVPLLNPTIYGNISFKLLHMLHLQWASLKVMIQCSQRPDWNISQVKRLN